MNEGDAVEIGYKVIRTKEHYDRTYLFSAIVMGRGSVQYKMDVFTHPMEGFGPLAVFDTLFNAEYFVKTRHPISRYLCNSDRLIIYRCEFIRSEETTQWRKVPIMGDDYKEVTSEFPEGTILASSVKLLKIMEDAW